MRLIDADALIQHTYSAVIDGVKTDIIDTSNVDNAPTIIWCSENSDGLPLMDLRPRQKGEWIFNKEMSVTCSLWNCSVCNRLNGNDSFNYCPNCGTDMRGDDDGLSVQKNDRDS